MGRPETSPYCIIARVAWGALRTLRVPEAWIPRLRAAGWRVVIRDSEMPSEVDGVTLHSNPRRLADEGETT